MKYSPEAEYVFAGEVFFLRSWQLQHPAPSRYHMSFHESVTQMDAELIHGLTGALINLNGSETLVRAMLETARRK